MNIELKEDLAALSVELRRLQVAEEECHASRGPGTAPEGPPLSDCAQADAYPLHTPNATTTAREGSKLREAEQVRQTGHCPVTVYVLLWLFPPLPRTHPHLCCSDVLYHLNVLKTLCQCLMTCRVPSIC